MKKLKITLTGKQYALLEKMLSYANAQKLAMNKPIDGCELFTDIIDDLISPVTDGWSTLDAVLEESKDKADLLRTFTSLLYPDDADYFIKQLSNVDLEFEDEYHFLKLEEELFVSINF